MKCPRHGTDRGGADVAVPLASFAWQVSPVDTRCCSRRQSLALGGSEQRPCRVEGARVMALIESGADRRGAAREDSACRCDRRYTRCCVEAVTWPWGIGAEAVTRSQCRVMA